ncbi:ATP-binding protein [Flagellimonas meridianipacifica]|uniref:Oxygen sensor histidine kinase NreB n=1 Tax=Flagellimonas meridianipacifica TaxID=1080225 RepID=A0A2T0M8M8_9FLAO|nr:ATP-binding protein [Allomuricauda pacifica]PRX53823.1 hypothetical protein CLV81_2211 [Allomuricauda pacifica]
MSVFRIALLSASLLLADFSFSQQSELNTVDSLVNFKQINQAFRALNNMDTTSLSSYNKARYYELLSRNQTLNNQEELAFGNYLIAKDVYAAIDSLEHVAKVNLQIVQLLNASKNKSLDYRPFLEEYVTFAEQKNDPNLLSRAYMQVGKCFINLDPQKTILYFKKAAEENQRTTDSLMTAKIHHNIGVLFAEHTPHLDSSVYHYDLALKQYKKQNLIDYISYIYNNKATVYKKQNDYKKAIQNYLKADSLPIKEYRKNNKKLLYGFLSDAYERNKDYENATKYLKLHLAYKDSIGEDEQNKVMLDIQEKYDNEKLRADNLESEARRIQNRNFLFAAIGLLIVVGSLAILLQKNTTKKRQLAEQEAILKQQRVDNLLKEQELVSIDAMIAGQEKERQKVAGELHDDLGSMMATIKLHFDQAKIANQDPALQHAQRLLEEAYEKVRSMAHNKNSGLMSNQGLLQAIKKMAKTIGETNAMEVVVEDFGLGERMENSLELSIFRMIQELVANAIKHAEASKVNIQLTQHEENLNIIVEDNGKGFDRSQLDKESDGMGLTNIEKRVEHLEGNFTVDSILGKGTSILIDIPV